MRILITGGAGFIGSHISKLLLDQGDKVLLYDNLSKSTKKYCDKRAVFIQGDIKDAKLLKKSLSGVDAVIHMAGSTAVDESVERPLFYVDNNITGSVTLFEAMKDTGVKKVVFSSSCTVYGFPDKLPLHEDAKIQSTSPYGATKISIESFLTYYNYLYKFDVVILRYFNPYGIWESHNPETHAIPKFIKAALRHKPLPLYWKGEQIRDFIYIEDLARAHIAPLKLGGFHVFNVGSERGTRVVDVVSIISDIVGFELEVQDLGERAGDIPANYASSDKLNKATGWGAEVSLEEGLKRTVEWFKNSS